MRLHSDFKALLRGIYAETGWIKNFKIKISQEGILGVKHKPNLII